MTETLPAIPRTLLDIQESADMMFARGIVNTFHGLSDDHKTNINNPFSINPKAIIKHMFSVNFCGGLTTSHYRDDMLSDIDRVVKVLDGQKFEPRELERRLNDHYKSEKSIQYEDNYYRIKGHKNGNAHIEFKRQDILDKMNLIISKYYGDNRLV